MGIQDRTLSTEASERAEASTQSLAASSVTQTTVDADATRARHVAALKAAFQRGEGFVNLDRVAEGIIRDAEENA